MKILFLSDDFPPQSFGGAGIVAFNLAKALKEKGHTLSVITTVRNKEEEKVVECDGITVYRIYSNYHERWRAYLSLYNPQTVSKVRGILTETRPDVVHAHNIHQYLSYHCLKIAKENGAKVFLTAHDVMLFHYGKLVEFIGKQKLLGKFDYRVSVWEQFKKYRMRYNPFRNLTIRYYLKYANRIFSVSNAVREALNQNGINNVEVIHNGISIDDWSIDKQDTDLFRQKYGLEGKKVVLFGGRLSEAKGGNQALLALKDILEDIPNVILLVMGTTNKYAEQVLNRAKVMGIRDSIIFTGWITGNDLKAAYGCADVVLVPSIYLDPFPTINLEAMAAKKPVIGTCYGGTREIIIDGTTGYTVNPFATGEVAAKTIDILTQTEKGEQMGRVGQEQIRRAFKLEDMVEEYIVGYERK